MNTKSNGKSNGKSRSPRNGKNGSSTGSGRAKPGSNPAELLGSLDSSGWNSDDLSQVDLEEAWARRAELFAQAIEEEAQGEQLEVALVRMGREIYGIDAQFVFDIRPLEHLTRVPRVPDWVAGVVNLRGRIVSVLDLKRYLGFASSEPAGSQAGAYLVVVEIPEMELALMVDEVLGIEAIPTSLIQEATTAIRGIRPEYLRGVVVRADETQAGEQVENTYARPTPAALNGHARVDSNSSLMVILELPVLLADKQLIVHEEIL